MECLKMLSLSTMYGSLQLTIAAFVAMFIIFLRRVNTMIDMVANRVFDAYSRFKPGEETRNKDVLISLSKLKRFGDEARQRKAFQREIDKEIRESSLFDLKENKISVPSINKRPVTGLSCTNCCPESQESLFNRSVHQLSLVNLFNQDASTSDNKYIQNVCSDLFKVYSVKKYDYPRVEGTVLQDERLKKAVERTAIEQFHDINRNDESYYKKLIKNNEKRAYKLLYDMRSTLSDFLLRFTSWVLYKLLPLFLNSVIVHPGQVEMLNKASESGLPMIFIPLHRSHLDYIMVSFILLNRNIRSPLVAAGDNLRIPFFGSLLRGLGAFYIKRRIDPIMGRKDHVYKAVLHTYMNECLRAGHNIEFFLEGGRTRTGKPCMPKYGIFSVIIDAFMDGTIEDALLVPISMNYEKLIDGNFVREQLGEPKEMETFGLALKSIWKILNSNYGMMRIDFNQPFSLRELVKTFNASGKVQPSNGVRMRSRPSTTSLYGTDVVAEEQKQLVQSISKHVLFDCIASTAIMSTNALAFLLLNKYRNGVSIIELATAFDKLRIEILAANTDLGFTGDSVDVIHYAAELLGPGLVRIELTEDDEDEIIKPVCILPNVIELSYYSNCLIQHFILKSIIATALSAIDFTSGYVNEEELMQNCLELCDIFQFEFIFCKPCQNKEAAILNAIDEFILRDQIFVQNNNSVEYVKSQALATELLGNDEQYEEKTPEYKIKTDEGSMKLIRFYKDILNPWLEPYTFAASTLENLIGDTSMEGDLVKSVLGQMKQEFTLGQILRGESICADPIKNALKLFQHWEILECHAEGRVRVIYLRDQHDNSESVKSLYNRLNKYRSTI